MGDELPSFTAAAVQASPIFLDRDATIAKACDLIARASDAGADLIVFPETWIPGYPFWHTSDNVFSSNTFTQLWKNAVEVPSPATDLLAAAARNAHAYVVIGINERDRVSRGTLYNSIVYFSPDGEIIRTHRKLLPTFTERTIWGFGDGSDLDLLETPLGRVGGLICWEHQMTLAKYALYAQGEQVHCAVWPAYASQRDHIDFGMRQYAFEGACFVVSACGVITPGSLPKSLGGESVRAGGGTAIIGPDGAYLAGPVYDTEEILYARINLEQAIAEKHARDIAGHYARPDVFQLLVKSERKPTAVYAPPLARALLEPAADADAVIDRLETVRDYLSSIIDRFEGDGGGDSEMKAAVAEALASIDTAAAGIWSGK
ncbi:MAG: carbon-nitrogen hydrolase family protein [Chloroflexi bacterium]|nr:carbon-nitrogen hydrolase family protein [Chloroflexota bacterium]